MSNKTLFHFNFKWSFVNYKNIFYYYIQKGQSLTKSNSNSNRIFNSQDQQIPRSKHTETRQPALNSIQSITPKITFSYTNIFLQIFICMHIHLTRKTWNIYYSIKYISLNLSFYHIYNRAISNTCFYLLLTSSYSFTLQVRLDCNVSNTWNIWRIIAAFF